MDGAGELGAALAVVPVVVLLPAVVLVPAVVRGARRRAGRGGGEGVGEGAGAGLVCCGASPAADVGSVGVPAMDSTVHDAPAGAGHARAPAAPARASRRSSIRA